MGKRFYGKHIDYKKTGKPGVSEHLKKKLILEKRRGGRHPTAHAFNLLVLRFRKLTNMATSSTKVKKKTSKKKDSKWQSLVNGVGQTFTRSRIALRNLAKKLYEFLDAV